MKPHVPDAWIDWAKVKTGYEIPFTRHFYKYVPPRPLAEIDADLEKQVAKILDLLREVSSDTLWTCNGEDRRAHPGHRSSAHVGVPDAGRHPPKRVDRRSAAG